MERAYLTSIIGNPATLIPELLKGFKPLFQLEAFKNYDVIFHDVNNRTKRKKKRVKRAIRGVTVNGVQATEEVLQEVTRIALPLQKLIVETATTFLTGGKVDLKANVTENSIEESMLVAVRDVWNDNKLQYKNGDIAEAMMSQTEVAELWYTDLDEEGQEVLKVKIFKPSDGYTLQPIFDKLGKLIAFGIYYSEKNATTGEVSSYYDLYTEKEIRKHIKDKSGQWIIFNGEETDAEGNTVIVPGIIELKYGKIPIIYYWQPKSEWYDVQSIIDRLETLLSNHGDTNDYSGSPVLAGIGKISSMPDKGENGKVIQVEQGGDVKYVTPQNATESYKLEVENLKNFLMLCTSTPDLSLESLKGLGQIPSGAAFERLLISTYMKARRKQTGSYGEAIQRRVNFLKSALVVLNPTLKPAAKLNITPDYQPFTIDDIADRVEVALRANGNKPVMDQKASIEYVGVSDNAEETLDKIKEETDAAGSPLLD